jgi:hypothetical protein
MFNDSEVAKRISSARTKTEAIVNSVLAPHAVQEVIKSLQDIPFCGVSTDASNHGAVKIFPILIQYFDYENGGLQIKLLEVESKPNETAHTIAAYVSETLSNYGLLSKCVAFAGDNCNTMFGGLKKGGGKNVFANLKNIIKPSLIGVGCPAHVLNNCIQHGTDTLEIDIESIVLKVYNYFSIYTVRVESLRQFCEFVDIEYEQLLYHSKTRWLSLFPAIERLITMFPALKSFFLSQDKSPAVLKKFFSDLFSEIYLLHLHSLMCVFHSHIQSIEREKNSVLEILNILSDMQNILQERKIQNYVPLKVKGLLQDRQDEGLEVGCKHFLTAVKSLYSGCLEYLDMWIEPFKEFSCFKWMELENVSWTEVESSIKYMMDKGFDIDDSKCFNQFCNLKTFIATYKNEGRKSAPFHEKWSQYFKSSKSVECHSELLKMAQFFFAIPAHNANAERLFSLIQMQWSKERNCLAVESVKGLAIVKYNFRHFTCVAFDSYLLKHPDILKKIRSTEKYSWFKLEHSD